MRRGRLGDQVLYVERHGKLSLLAFVFASISVLYPAFLSSQERKESMPGALAYGAMFLVVAMILQFKSRTIVIDPDRGTIQFLERRFLQPSWRSEVPLAGMRVVTTSAPGGGLYWIWLERPENPRILFAGNLKNQQNVHDLVLRLQQDLRSARSPLPQD